MAEFAAFLLVVLGISRALQLAREAGLPTWIGQLAAVRTGVTIIFRIAGFPS